MRIGKPRLQSLLARWLDPACEYWLRWSLPPAGSVVAQSQWKCDDVESYCHRCGGTVADAEATETGCGRCRGKPVGVEATIRLGTYTPPLDDWVRRIKYERWHEMAAVLGRMLGSKLACMRVVDSARAIVVPMPMPWQRRLYRGMDHAAALARPVARALDAPMARILAKTNGPPQVALTATERQRIAASRIRVRRRVGGWPLDGLDVVLVDDVRTTGGSIRIAAGALRKLRPRRIVAAVVAVTEDRDRRTATPDAGAAGDATVATPNGGVRPAPPALQPTLQAPAAAATGSSQDSPDSQSEPPAS